MADEPLDTSPQRPRRARVAGAAKTAPAAPVAVMAQDDAAPEPGRSAAPPPTTGVSMREAALESLDLRGGSIGRVDARDVAVTMGALGGARAEKVSVEMGMLGGALAGEITVSQAGVGTVVAREARIEQSIVRTLIAQEVHVDRPSGVLVMLAQRVDGNVRAILDWRGAAAFGAAFALVATLLRRTRR